MYAISTNFVSPQYSYLQTCNIFSTDFKPSTTNEFTVKDYFHFAEEIVDQQHDLFMGSLDVDYLFTNTPLEETIEICTNELFKESETVEGLSKTELSLWLLRIRILFLMGHFINKSLVWLWVPN